MRVGTCPKFFVMWLMAREQAGKSGASDRREFAGAVSPRHQSLQGLAITDLWHYFGGRVDVLLDGEKEGDFR